jgi:cytochrome P450
MNTSAIPKASGLPLLGVALKFGPEWVRATRERLGDVFSFKLPGGNGGVMVTHPDDVRLALAENKGVARSEFPPPRDLLTMMIEMQDAHDGGLDDTSIRFELSGLFIAGKETSAVSLSWFLSLLPQRPDIARRLVEEIDRALGGREPQAADLPELRYLEAALQENLRAHPPVWLLFPRKATDDITVSGHGVQRGTTVWVSPFATHHHEAFWERPGEFEPERFAQAGAAGGARHPYAWIPFGGGPRVCIGTRFALMEMQLFVARLLQRYRIEWADARPVEPKVIFNTCFPRRVPIRLVPRAGAGQT